MPKILKLDMKPGEYGQEYENIVTSGLRRMRGRFDVATFDSFMQWYPAEKARIDADMQFLQLVCRMDAGEAAFFARQLEYIKARTYDIKYPEGSIQQIITVSSEAGPGADSIVIRQYNTVGKMALIGENTKDLPRVEMYGKEDSVGVKTWGESYGYTIEEIQKAMYAGIPMQTRKANAARLAYDQTLNDIGWNANGTAKWGGIRGLLYAVDVINTAADNTISLNLNWCGPNGEDEGTPSEQIISDITTIINTPYIRSKKVEKVNRMLLPVAVFTYLQVKRVSSVSDTTILEFVRKQFPGVKFEAINELANVKPKPSAPTGTATTDVVIAFNDSADNVTFEVPQTFTQMPVEVRGLEYTVNCFCRVSSVNVYYPKSMIIAEGIIKR